MAAAPEDAPGAARWVVALKHAAYDELSLEDRLEALTWLVGLVADGPGARAALEAREREAVACRKQLVDDARVRTAAAAGCITRCTCTNLACCVCLCACLRAYCQRQQQQHSCWVVLLV